MEYRIYEGWKRIGIVCTYCKRPCFVLMPEYTPSWMAAKYHRIYGGISIMATCVQGREEEWKHTGGYNIDYLINYVAHGEA